MKSECWIEPWGGTRSEGWGGNIEGFGGFIEGNRD